MSTALAPRPVPKPTATAHILAAINRKKPGEVFTAKDFLDIGSRGLIDLTLKKLADAGRIRRISRGLYDRPIYSEFLKQELLPRIDEFADAYARRFKWRIAPTGPLAANLLGISTQIPAQHRYLSSGPNKTIAIEHQTIEFKHASSRELGQERLTSLFIQAAHFLGRPEMEGQLETLRERIPLAARKRLFRETQYSSEWISRLAKRLAEP